MALTRLRTGGIAANAVVAASIAPGAVDITDIADGAVTEAKLAANAVTSVKIEANAITAVQIAANAVTSTQLSGNLDLTGKTVTLPAGVGGKVLQVVQATSTTGTSTTSTTFVSCGLSASITPASASNKILVLFSTPMFKNSGNAHGINTIFRGNVAGTNLGDANWGFGANYSSDAEQTSVNNGAFLDSPSTTSSQTYTIGFRTNTGVQITAQGNDGMGVITLMEIAG